MQLVPVWRTAGFLCSANVGPTQDKPDKHCAHPKIIVSKSQYPMLLLHPEKSKGELFHEELSHERLIKGMLKDIQSPLRWPLERLLRSMLRQLPCKQQGGTHVPCMAHEGHVKMMFDDAPKLGTQRRSVVIVEFCTEHNYTSHDPQQLLLSAKPSDSARSTCRQKCWDRQAANTVHLLHAVNRHCISP